MSEFAQTETPQRHIVGQHSIRHRAIRTLVNRFAANLEHGTLRIDLPGGGQVEAEVACARRDEEQPRVTLLRTYVPVTGRVAACVPTAGVAARVHGTTRFSVRGSSRASPASSSKWSTTCPTTHYLLTYYPVPTALPPSTDR